MGNIITYIQLFIFITFITYIVSKFGVLPSISNSYYQLEKNKRNSGILFTLTMWIVGFLMFFQTNGYSGLFFAAGAGLIFTGAATEYKKKMTKTVHFLGAFFGLLFPLIAVWYERGIQGPIIISAVLTVLSFIFDVKNETWWLEIAIVIFILIGLLI